MVASPRKPELNTNPLKIDKLIRRIDEGEIKIPAFQRGYVWKQNQVIELLESVTKQFPIGSLLLWEATDKEKLRSTRNIAGYQIPDRADNWPVNYVLDGQQRLSSLYGVFSEHVEQDAATEKYNPHLDIFEIYYDFAKKIFLPKSEVPASTQTMVKLRHLIDPVKLVDELGGLEKAYHQDAKELSSKFLNYEIPVVQIKNRTKEEVGVIFERINNTGTKLNTLDLMTAWTWTEDFHLLDSIEALLEELDDKSFGKIDEKLIIQIVSGVIIASTQTENVLKLTGERVRDNWALVVESLKSAIDFLATEFECRSIEFLPFHQQLVPLARFFSKKKRFTDDQRRALTKYFWRTSFSDRYSTGQTTAKMDDDIAIMDQFSDYDYSGLAKYQVTTTERELRSVQFSKANPLTRASLLLVAKNGPLDLANGRKVDVGDALTEFNPKQYHHIFPNSFLKKLGVEKSKRFSVVNFCFLPADSNKKISSKAPSEYFTKVIPAAERDGILKSNFLPTDSAIYAADDYEGFLAARVKLLLAEVSRLST